jgi:hypothetical protein
VAFPSVVFGVIANESAFLSATAFVETLYVKRCLGLKLYVKFENPSGLRIQQLFVGAEELEREATHTVAFVTSQGVPKKYGTNRWDLTIHAIDALKQYLTRHSRVNARLRRTVVAV